MPMDDCEFELEDTQVADIQRVRDRKVGFSGGFSDEIAQDIATRLDAAEKPVLIVGGDVERYGARDDIVALSERANATVWTAPLTGLSGFPENHSLYQGLLPAAKGPLSGNLTGHDFGRVIGAPVFRYYPYVAGKYLPDGARLVHITNDPDEAGRAPVGDAEGGDIRVATRAVLARITRTDRPPPQAPEASPTGPPGRTPPEPAKL